MHAIPGMAPMRVYGAGGLCQDLGAYQGLTAFNRQPHPHINPLTN